MPVKIDPLTGERVQEGAAAAPPQIDPATGERMAAAASAEKPGMLESVVDNVGTHLKNLVAGPYHAFTDALTEREKKQDEGEDWLGNPFAKGFYRMAMEPTVNGIEDAAALRRGGGPQASLLHGSSYDAEGNNVPTAGSRLVDSIPMYGPWARNAEDETHQKGFAASMAGLATDALSPKIAGKGLAAGMSRLAPALAEAALGTRATDRAYGRTPGQAVLSETSGIRPGRITEQASAKVADLTDDLHRSASASPMRARIDLARDAAQDAWDTAATRNSPVSMKKTGQLLDQLTYEVDPNGGFAKGTPGTKTTPAIQPNLLPNDVSPRHILDLKRGINDLGKSWNPNTPSDLADTAVSRAYRLLDEEGDRTIPGGAELNDRMSSLMPVMERAKASDLNAGVLQRVVGRFAKPTGALAGGISGYYLGGVPGAAIGLVAPEILSSPTTLMAGARLLHGAAPVAGRATPFLSAPAMNNPRDRSGAFYYQRPRLTGNSE